MLFYMAEWESKITSNGQHFIDNIISKEQSIFGNILNVVRLVGTGIALIMLTVMSISYFAANGKGMPWAAEKQADIKGRQLANFAIGAAVFIGASNILVFIANLVESMVIG